MSDLVSVIITTYKRTSELRKAINSVYLQTYKNLELIVVDDNIEEKYSNIVEKIILEYNNKMIINYIKNKKNLGGALSRNVGIDSARGKYISFLDDDDEYYPTKIQKQIELFETTNYSKLAIVYCYTIALDERNNEIFTYKNDVRGNFLFEAMCDCIAATSQWMCLKEALLSVGCFSDVPSKQDSTVLLKLALKGYQIDRVPEVLTKYYELDIERISSGGRKNIKGEKLLRARLRECYYKLDNKQIKIVEYNAARRIFLLTTKNKLYKESIDELIIMLKNRPYSLHNFKMICLLIYTMNKNIFVKHKK